MIDYGGSSSFYIVVFGIFITDECLEGLQVVKGIVAVLGHEAFGKVLQAIHPLLVTAELGLRLCICDILDGLALRDPSYAFLVIIALHMTNILLILLLSSQIIL